MTTLINKTDKHTETYTFDSIGSLTAAKHLLLLEGYGVASIKLLDCGMFELQVI